MTILSLAALFLAATASVAAASAELTLDAALRAAFAANPGLRSARYALEAADGRSRQTRAWPNPELFFSAEDIPRDGGFSDGKTLIGVSQAVPFPFKKIAERRAGGSAVEGMRTSLALAAVSLERDVKVAFYRALAAEKSAAISGEVAAVTARLSEAARTRVEAGESPLQESLRAEIELERALSDVVARERERDLAREALFALMGEPPRDVVLSGDLAADTTLTVPAPEGEPSDERHPLVALAERRFERAGHELGRAKLEPLPDLELRFAAGRDENDNDVMEAEAAISIPLFDFGGGARREKKAELEIARVELQAAEREFEAARRTASNALRAAAAQAAAYRDRILPRAEQALELVRRGFEAGKFGFIDLLDTQRTLAEARLTYVEKLLDLNTARAEWEALGLSRPGAFPEE